MSDLVDRLRRWAADAPPWIAMPYAGEAADRIETLEARLDRAVTRGLEQVEQIATLEAALREIARYSFLDGTEITEIARAALASNHDTHPA